MAFVGGGGGGGGGGGVTRKRKWDGGRGREGIETRASFLVAPSSSMLRHGSNLVSTPREDKAVFILRSCILILKVAKNFRDTFFRGVELIEVEVM